MKGTRTKSLKLLVLYLLIGAALGGIMGEGLANSSFYSEYTSFLVKPHLLVDLPPFTLDLHVFRLILGFSLSPTLASLLGMIVAYIFYRRQ